ncbi:UNVERIFIED_CONTAM: hypothetical protein FKN15_006793 [Acipenser sinensis]
MRHPTQNILTYFIPPAGTVSSHRSTVNPAGQAASVDTCRAGLCPPEAGSSLTSTLEFLCVKKEAGLVVGSGDAHSGLLRHMGNRCGEGKKISDIPNWGESQG